MSKTNLPEQGETKPIETVAEALAAAEAELGIQEDASEATPDQEEEEEVATDETGAEPDEDEDELPKPWEEEEEDEESEPLAFLQEVPENVREQVRTLAEKAAQADDALSWVNALTDPSTSRDAYAELGKRLGIAQEEDVTEDYDTTKYASPVEAQLARELAELKAGLAKDREAAALKEFAARKAPSVSKALNSKYPGFQVSAKMIEKAVTTYPQHRDDPERAVKAYYVDQLAEHRAKAVIPKSKAPTMARGGRSEGTKIDWANLSVADAVRLAESSNS